MHLLILIATLVPLLAHAASPSWTQEQVEKHATLHDCWIVIDGQVYDVSLYIPKHPAPETAITKYCGKNADSGWKTKDKNRAHSRSAARLLKRYWIGEWVKK